VIEGRFWAISLSLLTSRGGVQNELQRQQHDGELVHLRERERQLEEEVTMRRTLDAFNQRQIYELLKDNDQLRSVSREHRQELERLSDPQLSRRPDASPSPEVEESTIAPLPVIDSHNSIQFNSKFIHCVSKETAPLRQVGTNSVVFEIQKYPKYTFCREFHSA